MAGGTELYPGYKPLETRVTDPKTGGQKGMKPERMALLPWGVLREISKVYGFGAKKYDDPKVGPYNWRRGYAYSLSFDAMQRHLSAWWEGEDMDPESHLPHLCHAAWHIFNLLFYQMNGVGKDDRPHTYFAQSAGETA